MLTIPKGLSQIKKTYGDFTFTRLSGTNIDVDDSWEAANLVYVKNVGGTGCNIRLHRLVMPEFEGALAAARMAAPKYKVRMLGGYVPRQMKTLDPKKQAAAPLSTHSWGCAFDINWDTNPFSKRLITDIPLEFVEAFRMYGWQWGGDWKNSKDPMHFQLATGY